MASSWLPSVLALEIPLPWRPKQIDAELRALIRRMSVDNPLWGAQRIHGELLKHVGPHHMGGRSLADFITIIAEFNFQYRQGARTSSSRWPRSRCRGNCSRKYCGISTICDQNQPPLCYASVKHRAQSMKETTINIIDGLRGQQAQLKRLLAQKVWISDAPRPELSEIEAQVIEVKRLLAELEKNIQDQLQRGQ